MKPQHLPALSARFWVAISLASVLGANLGDVFGHYFHQGHSAGLPFLAAAFAATLLAERATAAPTEAFYWTAIVILRTAATNLGDLGTHDLHFNDLGFALLLAVPVAASVLVWDSGRVRFCDAGKPRAGALYWATMLVAGTLGTALGDGSADALSLRVSTGVWMVVWAVSVAATIRLLPSRAVAYWAMVCVVRTVGTNVGDWTAGRHGLHLGLPLATVVSGVGFLGVLVGWRGVRRTGMGGGEVAAAD
jgi:uncharacterized membrane-anchored protein